MGKPLANVNQELERLRDMVSPPPEKSKDAAEKYDAVLLLATDGKYTITPLLENAITSTRAERDEARAARRARLLARKRRRGGRQPAGP